MNKEIDCIDNVFDSIKYQDRKCKYSFADEVIEKLQNKSSGYNTKMNIYQSYCIYFIVTNNYFISL